MPQEHAYLGAGGGGRFAIVCAWKHRPSPYAALLSCPSRQTKELPWAVGPTASFRHGAPRRYSTRRAINLKEPFEGHLFKRQTMRVLNRGTTAVSSTRLTSGQNKLHSRSGSTPAAAHRITSTRQRQRQDPAEESERRLQISVAERHGGFADAVLKVIITPKPRDLDRRR